MLLFRVTILFLIKIYLLLLAASSRPAVMISSALSGNWLCPSITTVSMFVAPKKPIMLATYLTAISTSAAGPSEYTPPRAFNNAIFLSPIRPTGPSGVYLNVLPARFK